MTKIVCFESKKHFLGSSALVRSSALAQKIVCFGSKDRLLSTPRSYAFSRIVCFRLYPRVWSGQVGEFRSCIRNRGFHEFHLCQIQRIRMVEDLFRCYFGINIWHTCFACVNLIIFRYIYDTRYGELTIPIPPEAKYLTDVLEKSSIP